MGKERTLLNLHETLVLLNDVRKLYALLPEMEEVLLL